MSASKRLFFLDFIRLVSILLIILYHFDLEVQLEHPGANIVGTLVVCGQAIGDLGVTLFLIISGAALMVGNANYEISDFFKKRFLAIFPSYWVAYIAVSAVLFLFRGTIPEDMAHWKFLLTATGLDGFLLYRIPNYYLIGEWFTGFVLIIYLFFPILRVGVTKTPLLIGVLTIALSLLLHRFYDHFFTILENRNPLMRLPEFVFGMCFLQYIKNRLRLTFLLSACLLVTFNFLPPPIPPLLYGLLLGAAVFCVLAFVADHIRWPDGLLNGVTYLSKKSFLAFLVHHQIIYLLLPRLNEAQMSRVEINLLFLIVFFLSFLSAALLSRPVDALTKVAKGWLWQGGATLNITLVIKWLSLGSLLIGLGVALSSFYGVIHFFSPIPWYDEWDGYIGFYRNITTGYWLGWWIPHMEHRLLLPRAFFWADIRWFGGQHYFLFLAEQALQAGMVILIWKEYARGSLKKAPLGWIIGLPLALMFSWVQEEIFKWGFELQVIAVYFFALWASAQYSRFDARSGLRIGLALFLAALAEISMGNGMLAFAMLAAQGVLARRPIREIGFIILIAAGMWAVYFIGYVKPPIVHPALTTRQFATNALGFFFLFLGNPFAFFLPNLVCMLTGAANLCIATWLIGHLYFKREITSYRLFLIGGYGFVVLSSLAAMSGRAGFGVSAAAMSRYTTGPLLSWVLLTLLTFDVANTIYQRLVIFVSAVIIVILMPYQRHVRDDSSYLYSWKMAVLAHKIGLDRPDLDALLFPAGAHEHFSDLADFAEREHVALYGKGWLRDAGSVRYQANLRDDHWCSGSFDGIEIDKGTTIARGWAYAERNPKNMLVVLTDAIGGTVGYGVTGQGRPDVAKSLGRKARVSGWTGYLYSGATATAAYAYDNGKFCLLTKAGNF